MANAFLYEYSGGNALTISAIELPKPHPISFDEILEKQTKSMPIREEKKPDSIARIIQGFIGYAAFIEKMRAI